MKVHWIGAAAARALSILAVLALASLIPPRAVHAAAICRVQAGAAAGGDGTSWGSAYNDLQTALADATCTEIWVAAGTYYPTQTLDRSVSFQLKNGVGIYGGFDGTETQRNQRSASASLTVLSGNIGAIGDPSDNSYHVVTASAVDNTAVLDGFTVTAGLAESSYPSNAGAGIYVADGSPTLVNLIIEGNSALSGGGLYSTNSSPVLLHVTFHNNTASSEGGGMNSFGGAPSLTDVGFGANSASAGGGLEFYGVSGGSLSNVIFSGNVASGSAGGFQSYASDESLLDVTFSDNVAVSGGGMRITGNAPSLSNVTFSNNHATLGGGLYVWMSDSVITNSTFFGNSAAANGGGLFALSSSPTLRNATFHGNSAGSHGGALYDDGSGSVSTPGLTNLVLSGDTAAAGGNEIYNVSSTPAIDHSLVRGSMPGGIWDTSFGSDGGGNLDANPLLGAMHNNGGLTLTMALISGSPAIDAGTNTGCPSTDQRGGSRPVNATCDMGAVEYQGHLFADVPVTGKEWMEPWTEAFYYAGFTTGCGVSPLIYCPENNVTRAEMAVFLLRSKHGGGYTPPPATHVFSDMPVAGKEWMEPWVDEFYAEGMTTGCGTSPLIFCPENYVTRAEMAVFILRAINTPGWTPPPSSGVFADLPVAGKEWMESWVDHFYAQGITTGCATDPLRYCPENNVTRAEMAVFIDRVYVLYP